MSTSNRAALLTKTHKVLKKHYKPVSVQERSVLEHLLYACCLENSKHEDVDVVMAKLDSYFDWNEVRVSTVSELAEVMSVLRDPAEAATRLKRTLHSVFETHYSFDLEVLKKQTQGAAVKEIEKFHGVTPFVLSYVTQNALGGHAIPVNRGALNVFVALGIITASDAEKRRVPGLERAISKSKGAEFASLIHQFGVDYDSSPFSAKVRSIALEIAPDAKDRLPKRSSKKKSSARNSASPQRAAKKRTGSKSGSPTGKKKSATKRLTRKKPR